MKILKNLILAPDSSFFKIFQKKIVANMGNLSNFMGKHYGKDRVLAGHSSGQGRKMTTNNVKMMSPKK